MHSEDVGPHPFRFPVEDGADAEIHRLHAAEGALHGGEGLVGPDRLLGGEQGRFGVGADDVEAVEGLFGGDGFRVAAVGEGGVGGLGVEVLLHLELADDLPDPALDGVGSAQGPALAADSPDHRFQFLFGAAEQVFAFPPAFGFEAGVEADHQAFAGEQVGGDLGQVALVEEGGVHLSVGHQGADGGGAQGGDPAEPVLGAQVFAEAFGGEHSPVADQDHLAESEAVPQFFDLGGDGLGVGGVPGEDLDRDRAAFAGAEQPEDDLEGAALSVAAVSAPGQGAPAPLEVGGGEVVEDEGVVAQVPGGQPVLDGFLAGAEPVEGVVEFVLLDFAEIEEGSQGGGGGAGVEGAGGGEFGAGVEDAGADEGEGEAAEAGGDAVEQGREAEAAEGSEDGGGMSVGEGAADLEGVFGGDQGLALEEAVEGFDSGGVSAVEFGEVGEGAFLGDSVFAVGLAEEDGGQGVAVGDVVDEHGYEYRS